MTQQLTEKAMAPYSSTLAWKIPWMEEPGVENIVKGGLQELKPGISSGAFANLVFIVVTL